MSEGPPNAAAKRQIAWLRENRGLDIDAPPAEVAEYLVRTHGWRREDGMLIAPGLDAQGRQRTLSDDRLRHVLLELRPTRDRHATRDD